MTFDFPRLENEGDVSSPALLIDHARAASNIQRMLAIAGDPARLCPHVKTHKLPPLVAQQIELGITKFKCATVAEAEMVATTGGREVLVAMQPVGPQINRIVALSRAFPETRFSTIVDNFATIGALSRAAVAGGVTIDVLIDLDIGQHRTGVAPGPDAAALYRQIANSRGLRPAGLHAYDGHLHQSDPGERNAACEAAFAPVAALRRQLEDKGLAVPRLIVGGTPTFPMHARRPDVECSPGTCVLWDAGYKSKLPDQDFELAAAVLTRIVSKPTANRLCLDLGHKAVGSEMPHPRAVFAELPDATPVTHSEEHLVLETDRAADFSVGDALYAIPWHICPTVALHAEAWFVDRQRAVERWPILARARRLSI